MDVILLQRVEKLGQMGDVVSVKPGYARNYLLPHNKAKRATKANKDAFEAQRVQLEARDLQLRKEAEDIGGRVQGLQIVLIRQAGDSGQLYGSVNARDVADAVTEGGFTITRNQVTLDKPIKTLGMHPVRVVLHPDISVAITANVARTADEAEAQAAGRDPLRSPLDDEDEDEPLKATGAPFEDGATSEDLPGMGEQPDTGLVDFAEASDSAAGAVTG